jgi:cbb3-type cytochrome oxidase subunit 3
MNNIPWYGWAALICIGIFFLTINLMLISALRKKKKGTLNQSNSAVLRLGQAIRQPWKTEDDMLAELSRRATELRKDADSNPGSGEKNA